MQQAQAKPAGRFAPTPSGPLHFGSLVSAIASYCHAKSKDAKWLVRIEDIDTPRVITGATENILRTLEIYGFEWDGEILYQSQRFEIYQHYLNQLIQQDFIYGCSCSRKKLQEQSQVSGPLGTIYGGYCRHTKLPLNNVKLRLNVESAGLVKFHDQHYGEISRNLEEEIGDIILKRKDGIYAYHLAVVIDDALQQINEIVRGADLLDSTCVHIYLNKLFSFSNAQYLHIPLIKNKDGDKLSKQTGASALPVDKPQIPLLKALQFLGQNTPQELASYKPEEILHYAVTHWDSKNIPITDRD